jgi:hypothetical protein
MKAEISNAKVDTHRQRTAISQLTTQQQVAAANVVTNCYVTPNGLLAAFPRELDAHPTRADAGTQAIGGHDRHPIYVSVHDFPINR